MAVSLLLCSAVVLRHRYQLCQTVWAFFCPVKPLVKDCDLFQQSTTYSQFFGKESMQLPCHYLLDESACVCAPVFHT